VSSKSGKDHILIIPLLLNPSFQYPSIPTSQLISEAKFLIMGRLFTFPFLFTISGAIDLIRIPVPQQYFLRAGKIHPGNSDIGRIDEGEFFHYGK